MTWQLAPFPQSESLGENTQESATQSSMNPTSEVTDHYSCCMLLATEIKSLVQYERGVTEAILEASYNRMSF